MKQATRCRVIVGAFVDPALKSALERYAIRADRSVSAEIRIALRAHLGLPPDDEPNKGGYETTAGRSQ